MEAHVDFIEMFLWYSGLLIFSAMVINGIYITTRGETVTAPDGTEMDRGEMVFYFFNKWLTKKKSSYFIPFKGDQLLELLFTIQKMFPSAPSVTVDENKYFIVFRNAGEIPAKRLMDAWQLWTKDYFKSKDIVIDIRTDTETEIIFTLSEEYPVYKYSKYIRKPIVQCIKCMASFWGTILFWLANCMVWGFDVWQLIIWIPFCFALSWVNVYLFNKVQ